MPHTSADPSPPTVESLADVAAHAGAMARVVGVYRQNDVRMMQVDPDVLHLGHAVVELADGARVYLYPPADPAAIRPPDEIRALEGREVAAIGLLLPTIPQEGAVERAPCLVEIESIEATG